MQGPLGKRIGQRNIFEYISGYGRERASESKHSLCLVKYTHKRVISFLKSRDGQQKSLREIQQQSMNEFHFKLLNVV